MWGQLDGYHIALPHQSRQQESCTSKVTSYTAVTAATINTQYLHYGNTYDIPLHASTRQPHYPPEFDTTHFPPERHTTRCPPELVSTHCPPDLSRSKKISGNTAGLHTREELRQCSDASSAQFIRPRKLSRSLTVASPRVFISIWTYEKSHHRRMPFDNTLYCELA
ncbi:hypothetical protein GN958_ATG22663 [Phytophthora infestans]|uniref:Uncharacterized protein n=1 Tax=Phytophthora infestans TaxID=4787 RepID=A0A8S9TMQ1_PHYIN|nr:hypothetical protein GN958_ATG22657 [Phytophthora infestans]KAF4128114.1 hypothetical protein GN958_ATG22660 [Phytophthora infestans]KAF4128117.1 hypothetical protein GN958_ATG22663 [Phytophthora infestans]